MNANIMLNEDITPIGTDYDTVRGVIELLTLDYREQPSLEAIAAELGQSPTQLQKTFTRWAGLSPKAFLQAVTLDHAKRLLREEDLPLLETSIEVGMSGPGRLHDLFVTHEAMSPGEWKAKGGGLLFHDRNRDGVTLDRVNRQGKAKLAHELRRIAAQ